MADNTIANAIKFLKGEEKSLPAAKTEGQVYFAYKNVGTAEKPSYTGAIYIDTPIGGTQNRIKMTANADIADKAFNDSAGLSIRDTYLSSLGYTNDGKQTILIKGSGNNQTRIALPIASTTKSGIVTTDAQSFGGTKTFTTINSTNLTVTGSSGFNYSGIETATESKARPIWFADSSGSGKPVINTNFTYNPATQTLSVANLSGTADKATNDSGGQNIRSTYISSVEADKDNKYKYNFKTPTGAIRNSITIYDEFQKRSQVDATTDWNTLTSTGIYKVQMSAWGDATKMHSPNGYNKDLYSFGILLVFESIANDSEKRFTQIYIPHNANISISGSAYKRMHNGSDITTGWQGWHPIARGLNWSELTGKPNYAGSSSAGGAATSANKLNTNAGSITLPVYFSNGVPVACSTNLAVNITGNAASATKLTSSAGSVIQPIYFKDGKPVATTYSLNAHVQASSGEDFSTGGWKKMNGNVSGSYITVGYNNNPAIWNSERYSASIVFGKYDTKGLLDCSCDTSIVTFGGASNHNSTDDNPYWYFKLSGTSGQTYTFPVTSKTLAANDGSNASGTWGISITGNAASANKLNTNAGSATRPIYFSGGIPIQCDDTLASSITGSAYHLFIGPPEDKKAGGLYMFQKNGDTNFCPSDDWWSILRTQHPGYDNGYWQEMAYNFHNDRICFRRNVNGTKTPWKEIAFTDSDITGKSASTDALNWTHGNEIRFTKPNYTEPQTLHIAYAWADGSQSNLINDYRFNNGNGYNLAQVTASQFNGNLNGNANTASNLNGINTILSTGIENSAITIKTNNNGIFTLTNNCSLRNAIDFRWYGTNWQIGNIRGNSTDSIGFGFAFSSNGGNTFALKSYIDTNGYYHGGVVGNANTASKLATARNIALGGLSSGSANFDGSGNVTINDWGYGVTKYVTRDSASAPYYRIAYCEVKGNYIDKSVIFTIDSGCNGGGFGIVKVCLRADNTTTAGQTYCEVSWLVRQGFSADQLLVKVNSPAGTSTVQYADLYFKATGTYNGITVKSLSSTSQRDTVERAWTFTNPGSESCRAQPNIRAYTATYTGYDAGTALCANKLQTARTIFGHSFDGTGDIGGKGWFYGHKTDAGGRFCNSAIEIRENDLVDNSQSDFLYAPSIGFHWSNRVAGFMALHTDGNFYFRKQNGNDRATIDANLNGNASTASYASSAGNATQWNGRTLDIDTEAGSDAGWLLIDNGGIVRHRSASYFATASHTHPYLPLSGGTMNGTSFITWPDSGNWSNNNNNVTFPVSRGGLQWYGQSDFVKLFSQETGNDNLELVLQFGDDNSNGLSIRNSTSTQTAHIDANGNMAATSLRVGNGSGSTINFCTNGSTANPGAKIVAYNDRIEFVFA